MTSNSPFELPFHLLIFLSIERVISLYGYTHRFDWKLSFGPSSRYPYDRVIALRLTVTLSLTLAFGVSFPIECFSNTSASSTRCTVAHYIGEICRYLVVAARERPNDPLYRSHHLRVAFGNGLRPDVIEKMITSWSASEPEAINSGAVVCFYVYSGLGAFPGSV